MQDKKLRKKLIFSIFSLFVAMIALIGASFAWLSSNRQVESGGLQMQIDTTANIVISNSIAGLKSADVNGFHVTLTKPVSHEWSRLLPATHGGSGESKLVYSSNPIEIDATTGLNSNALTTEVVEVSNNSHYYVDYVAYLGSTSKSIEGATLTAEFLTAADTTTFKGATSVDFYVNGTYKDTLNLAGYDSNANDYTTEKTIAGLGTLTIPMVSNEMEPIVITMRYYFDGALLKSNGQAFIAVSTIDIGQQSLLSIKFTASGGTEA